MIQNEPIKTLKKKQRGQIQQQISSNFNSEDNKWKIAQIQHQYKKIKFSTGYYKGEILNHKLDGQGKLLWLSDGSIYQGCVKIIYENGSIYYGEVNEKYSKHGTGTLTLANGSYYSGQFKHQQRHGRGQLVTSLGKVFEGVWANDKLIKRM